MILVNLQEKIEMELEGLEEMLSIDIEDLERRHQEGKPLSKRELWFVYKLDKLFNKEIRVKEGEDIEKRRKQIEIERENKKRDLAQALDCREEQISLTKEEIIQGDINCHYGSLEVDDPLFNQGLDFPKYVLGNISSSIFKRSISIEKLCLPKFISGNLSLREITLAKGLKLPEHIGGDLDIKSIISAEGLELPKSIDGQLYLNSLTSADSLVFPKCIGGGLWLLGLTSTEGLNLPESIGGGLFLGVGTAVGLKLPKYVGYDLVMNNLTSIEGLELPQKVGGIIYLYNLLQEEKEELKRKYPYLASKIE